MSRPRGAESGVVLGPELVAALAAARRRATRYQDREIDTAHLLHSLLESDPEIRAVLGAAPVAKLLGYLVQRSIGYGMRWRMTVEGAAAGPAMSTAGLSPAAARAMQSAAELALRRGELEVRGVDLLAAFATDADCRAVEVLRRAALGPEQLGARVALARIAARQVEDVGL